jgi:hypothetical protein
LVLGGEAHKFVGGNLVAWGLLAHAAIVPGASYGAICPVPGTGQIACLTAQALTEPRRRDRQTSVYPFEWQVGTWRIDFVLAPRKDCKCHA